MRMRQIVVLEAARDDLEAIDIRLTDVASEAVAARFVDRIFARLGSLSHASERGTIRPEVPGLRVIGLLRNVSVAFIVTDDKVVVHRIFHGGQDWQSALTPEGDD